uniref:F-box domain-containing protein n=1 Tax=Caenorhabditis tropicalis TaxID=1561998 RepID=A0A1I7UDH7_9PELO
MHLLKIPVVALKEVFKMMDHHEIVLTALTSKRDASIMQSCTIKTPTEITFQFFKYYLNCQIGIFNIRLCRYCRLDRNQNYHFDDESVHIHNTKCDEPTYRNFIERVVQIYYKPRVDLFLQEQIRDVFGVELIRLLNYGPLRSVDYDIRGNSPKCYKKVFNEAATLEYLNIRGSLPDNFRFSPSVSLRLDELIINGSCDWIKLEDFMDCKNVRINPYCWKKMTSKTVKKFNLFFKKLKESECRMEKFVYRGIMDSSVFLKVIRGLSKVHGSDSVEFTRKDLKKSRISWRIDALLMDPVY